MSMATDQLEVLRAAMKARPWMELQEYARLVSEMQHAEFLRTKVWIVTRDAVFDRDRRICCRCRAHQHIQAHHLTYAHKGFECFFLEDLVTLCADCHYTWHTFQRPRSQEPVVRLLAAMTWEQFLGSQIKLAAPRDWNGDSDWAWRETKNSEIAERMTDEWIRRTALTHSAKGPA